MKKLDLSSQLIVLFFTILLVASCIFSLTTMSYAKSVATKESYNRLTSYALILDNNFNESDAKNNQNIDIGYYIKQNESTSYQNLEIYNKLLTEEDILNIVNEIKSKNSGKTEYITQISKFINKKKVSFVSITKDNMETYTLVYTDNVYTEHFIRDIVVKINCLFISIILVSIIVIYFWSNKTARRLRKIQNHILSLPSNNYESSYLDGYEDEVGDLSKSVEVMRSEICENEKIKKEMLHNLSHDFKTPIAVIKTYAEAIQDGVEDNNVSASKIIEQAEILKKKVNKLIQYNRLEYFNTDKEFEDIKMADIINDIVINYKHQLENIEFELDLDENVYFKGFSENWYTVVDNIIDNAKRYAKTKIKVVLKPDRLRIYNDGEHIEEKFIKKSFKPYEKGSEGQFGLGMSIVQKTVEYFNMYLHVVNEDIGVSFIIDNKVGD